MPKQGYTTITINEELHNRMKLLIEKLNERAGYKKFRSVSHFVEESIMKHHEKDLHPLEHFNLNEDGVRILDRGLGNGGTGRIVDVYFKQGKVLCDYCESSKCKHVNFALTLPQVQKIIRKKGWQLPSE